MQNVILNIYYYDPSSIYKTDTAYLNQMWK